MMKSMTIDELTLKFNFAAGDIQPLVDYLRRELKEKWAQDFFAGVLYGEIKRGDSRRDRRESRQVADVFAVRRLRADHAALEHGELHVTDAEIYHSIDINKGYQLGTAERHVKRDRQRKKRKG
jgi:hypothetical protein